MPLDCIGQVMNLGAHFFPWKLEKCAPFRLKNAHPERVRILKKVRAFSNMVRITLPLKICALDWGDMKLTLLRNGLSNSQTSSEEVLNGGAPTKLRTELQRTHKWSLNESTNDVPTNLWTDPTKRARMNRWTATWRSYGWLSDAFMTGTPTNLPTALRRS